MSHLVVCPGCKRHVRPSETECPFCSGEIPEALRRAAPPPKPPSGLSRARAYAFRAAIIASVAGAGCGSDDESPGPSDASSGTAGTTSTGGTAGSGTGGTAGTAGDDAGTGGTASGGTSGGNTGGVSGTPPMPYGCVWPDPEATVVV